MEVRRFSYVASTMRPGPLQQHQLVVRHGADATGVAIAGLIDRCRCQSTPKQTPRGCSGKEVGRLILEPYETLKSC